MCALIARSTHELHPQPRRAVRGEFAVWLSDGGADVEQVTGAAKPFFEFFGPRGGGSYRCAVSKEWGSPPVHTLDAPGGLLAGFCGCLIGVCRRRGWWLWAAEQPIDTSTAAGRAFLRQPVTLTASK